MRVLNNLPQADLRTTAVAAIAAEKAGYDGLLTMENKHDPFLAHAIAAVNTDKVELGTSVAIAFPRSPMVVANACWDLQNASRGRFVLGIGPQIRPHNEKRFSVPWTAPAPRLREYVQALRAIWTTWHALDEMDRHWLPVVKHWRLNERHYGALQGLNKAETARQYGDEQVLVWRRSYDTPPPALEAGDPRCERGDRRYAGLAPSEVPLTECLKDTVARVLPYWNDTIAPAIRSGQRVLISAHGNSIRALVKYLDNIGDADIVGVNIPNGIPLVYELDANLKPIKSYYLGDAEAAAKAAAAVASQGKA